MNLRPALKRSACLAISAVVGLLLAGFAGWAQFCIRGPFSHDSFAAKAWLLGISSAFILGILWTGELCYRLSGDQREAATIGTHRRRRMLLLNLIAIPLFVLSWFVPT